MEPAEATPKSLLREALATLKIPRKIQIQDKTQEQPRLKIDPQRMQRIFFNIIKNAFDAMPNGGELVVSSKKLETSVAITFSDTGVGIPKENIDKLWNPLFTTKAKGMGFGLPANVSSKLTEEAYLWKAKLAKELLSQSSCHLSQD